MKIYAVRNRLIGAYLPPVFTNEDSASFLEAQRRFCILQKEEALKAHLNECELYYLGEYNDKTAKFDLLSDGQFIADLGQFFGKEIN